MSALLCLRINIFIQGRGEGKKKGGGVGGKVVAPQKMMLFSLMRTAARRPPSRLHRSAPSRLAVYADTHFFPNQPLGSFRRVRYGSGLLRGNLAGIHLTPVVTWWNDTFNHCTCDCTCVFLRPALELRGGGRQKSGGGGGGVFSGAD